MLPILLKTLIQQVRLTSNARHKTDTRQGNYAEGFIFSASYRILKCIRRRKSFSDDKNHSKETFKMRLKIQLTCYLILITTICFTGFEIFQSLNKIQNNYLQKLEILKDA